jgi:serine/threonine protein kinase
LTGPNYRGNDADLFAFGVLVFVLVLGHYPFDEAKLTDEQYKNLQQQDTSLFWKNDCTKRGQEYDESLQTPTFKHFIESLLKIDRKQRLNLQQVATHPWMNEDRATNEEVKLEFERRRD